MCSILQPLVHTTPSTKRLEPSVLFSVRDRTYFAIASLVVVGTTAVAAILTVRQYLGDKRRGAMGDATQTYRSIEH